MAHSTVSTHLPLSPEQAWALLSDFSRFDEWLTIHDAWRSEPPATIAVGTQLSQKLTVMGMTNVIDWTVDTYDPPRSLVISGSGMAGARITFVLSVEPDGDGSTAAVDADFSGQMVVGAIASALEKNTDLELTASLEKLTGLAS